MSIIFKSYQDIEYVCFYPLIYFGPLLKTLDNFIQIFVTYDKVQVKRHHGGQNNIVLLRAPEGDETALGFGFGASPSYRDF